MQPFDYIRPQSIDETSRLLAQAGTRARVLAGGVDLLPRMELGQLAVERLLDIKRLPETSRFEMEATRGLHCGAATSLRTLAENSDVRRHFSLLAQICERIASPQIRNRATIGGAICAAAANSSLAPVLICYDAVCHLFGPAGHRRLPLAAFFSGPGLTTLAPDEILLHLFLPLPDRSARAAFHQVRSVTGGHGPVVGVAAVAARTEAGAVWRLAVTGAAPHPFRATEAEPLLADATLTPARITAAVARIERSCRPADDPVASAAYRQVLVAVLARRSIEDVAGQLAGGNP